MPFRKRDIHKQIQGFEFVCVEGFSAVVFPQTLAQVSSWTDVGLVRIGYAPQKVYVIHKARLRLPDLAARILTCLGRLGTICDFGVVLQRASAFAPEKDCKF